MPQSHGPDHSLADIVRHNAERFPDVPAYRTEDRGITHRQLYERATTLAAALAQAGLRRTDRIALFGRNSIAFGEVLAAGQLSGIIVATVNFRLAPPEIGRILADTRPRVLFADAEYLPVVDTVCAGLEDLPLVVRIDRTAGGTDGRDLPSPTRADADGRAAGGPEIVGYEAFLASAAGADLPFAARPDDIACLIFTSGTTGRPKGAILGQREMYAGAHLMNVEMRGGSDDRVLLTMPLFHIGAMAIGLGIHARGGTAVLHREFSPPAVLETVQAERVTVLHLAPTMLQALLSEAAVSAAGDGPGPLAGVRTVVYSAAPITATTLRAALAAMPDAGFLNLYGQTEVMTSGLPRELHRGDGPNQARRLTSVGHPFPENDVRIVDDTGADCPPGTPGEILVASPAMFRGYWNDSVATAATIVDGWCRTGDVGVVDEEGLLHLVDRKKDVIISGGENIYSLEVEDAVVTHPAVARAAVVGVPDARFGEAVCAVVELTPEVQATGDGLDAAALRDHVAARIARYKAPRSVVVVDQLPVLATGKIDKKALRAQLAAQVGDPVPAGTIPAG